MSNSERNFLPSKATDPFRPTSEGLFGDDGNPHTPVEFRETIKDRREGPNFDDLALERTAGEGPNFDELALERAAGEGMVGPMEPQELRVNVENQIEIAAPTPVLA